MSIPVATVDPTNIPKKLTKAELEAWILFSFTASTKNTVYDLGQHEPAFVEQMRRERPDIFAKITAHMVQPV